RSKTKSSDSGWEVHCRGNEIISQRPISHTTGTEIEVKELFYNTPARKKFLKSDSSELNQILNTFIPYTLLYPKIRFLLSNNTKPLIDLIPEKDYISRIAKALNLDKEHILEDKYEFTEQNICIKLILGDINIQRTDKNLQFIFINDRPIQNRNLSFHLNQVYKLIMPDEAKPFFAVFITMPCENLDVNVHPAKREVKIKDEQSLISLLRYSCEQTLMTKGKAKQFTKPYTTPSLPPLADSQKDYSFSPRPNGERDRVREKPTQNYKTNPPAKEENLIFFQDQEISIKQQGSLADKLVCAEFIGIFQKKYLLFEANKSLLIIDQHAAHERINYEKLTKQIESGKVEMQNLLTPVLIRLTRQELLVWEEIKTKLEELGFSTSAWDEESIAIHSHPQLIDNPEKAARNILSGNDTAKNDINALARRACRQSVMTGERLKKEQAVFLKNELLKCKTPFTCPHGRPTTVEIQESFLNKQFLRG
ncbi:MAG: DNA mismatch repair endonuclease MutL, partial [Candidatus Omnitrophota bacterium]